MRTTITFLKNSNMSKKVKSVLAVLVVIILLGIAGRMDYTEQTMYNMPNKAYNEIKDTLGEDASDYEIAKYYNKVYKDYVE